MKYVLLLSIFLVNYSYSMDEKKHCLVNEYKQLSTPKYHESFTDEQHANMLDIRDQVVDIFGEAPSDLLPFPSKRLSSIEIYLIDSAIEEYKLAFTYLDKDTLQKLEPGKYAMVKVRGEDKLRVILAKKSAHPVLANKGEIESGGQFIIEKDDGVNFIGDVQGHEKS